MISLLIQAIFSGICISIAATVFLSVGGGVIGSLLFSMGLLTILSFQFKLYTGAVGYVSTKKDILDIFIILIGNIIGCCLIIAFPSAAAGTLVATKLVAPIWSVLIKSIICGFLMYIAVEAFKKQQPYLTVLSVMSFISLGAEHSIANICFFLSAQIFDLYGVVFILINILGNAVGAITTHNLINYIKEHKQ